MEPKIDGCPMKRWPIPTACILLSAMLGVYSGVRKISISAVPEPGPLEASIATYAKHILVRSGSRNDVRAQAIDHQTSIAAGDKLYGAECAMCHGLNGRTPTDTGRWMYPRAADLSSKDVQRYSDVQLFWIVKNGVRMTGMPAFGKVETDEHMWDLVRYIRGVRRESNAASNAR